MNMDDDFTVEFDEQEEPKKSSRTVLIIVGVIVLLCCLCIVFGYVFYQFLGDPLVNWLQTQFNF